MRVKLWGTRGSVPAPGPETIIYGGNTSCVEVIGPEGTRLVLDAGTGVGRLGRVLSATQGRIDILLTHLHLDHIQGLGFFGPLRNPDFEVHFWGPASTTLSLRERLSRYLSPPLFPVYLRDMTSKVFMHEVTDEEFEIGEFKITSALVIHYDPTVGYRIENSTASVAYLPDHEPTLGVRKFPIEGRWTSGYSLAVNSDLLIHDAQYTVDEYADRVGWGHSSVPDAFAFADFVKTKHFVPFHHDPTHDDDILDNLYDHYIQSIRPPFAVSPGADGLVFDLNGEE
jgi:phosphoribosyl 1,2-cyclic phosphodiesterase